MPNIVKDFFSLVRKEISTRLRPKNLSLKGLPGSDPDYMYDIYIREFSGMKPENLLYYIDWARKGAPFYFYKYYDAISKRDTRIKSMLRKLKAAILMEQFKVSGEWKEGVEFAELLIKHLGGKLFKFFTDVIDANTKGITRFNISYEYSNGYWLPSELRAIPSWMNLYDPQTRELSLLDVSKFDQMKLRTTLASQPDKLDLTLFPRIDIDPLNVLDVHAIDGDDDNPFMNGIVIALLFAYYCKSYTVKDLNIFLEQYASPTKILQYDPLNDQSKDEMTKLANDGKRYEYLLYPDGSKIELLNDTAKGQGGNLYLSAIDYWNSEISILFAGESETTQMGTTGSYSALQVKKQISELILMMNLKTITNAFSDLLKKLIEINFSTPGDLPLFEYIKISTLGDKKTQSDINLNLKSIGYLPTQEELQEQFGVELEKVEAAPVKQDPEKDPDDDPDNKPDDPKEEKEEDYSFMDKIFFEAEKEAA